MIRGFSVCFHNVIVTKTQEAQIEIKLGEKEIKFDEIKIKQMEQQIMEQIEDNSDVLRHPRASSQDSIEFVRTFDRLDMVFIQEKYKHLSWTRVFSLTQRYANVEMVWALSDDLNEHKERATHYIQSREGISYLRWDPQHHRPADLRAPLASYALSETAKFDWAIRVVRLRQKI